jgi:predicted GNAT family acetyltransferase
MVGLREISDASLNALATLISPGDVVGLFGPEPVSEAGDLLVVAHKHIDQMTCDRQDNSPQTGHITALTAADVPDMLQLVELTRPGPFSAGTIVLGSYLGIRYAGKLIAMAGERMRFDGFTEISAVCTHPAFRGCGHASSLIRALVRQIIARGETPFLHLYSDNTLAAALYTKLGFAFQRRLIVTVLRRADFTP